MHAPVNTDTWHTRKPCQCGQVRSWQLRRGRVIHREIVAKKREEQGHLWLLQLQGIGISHATSDGVMHKPVGVECRNHIGGVCPDGVSYVDPSDDSAYWR